MAFLPDNQNRVSAEDAEAMQPDVAFPNYAAMARGEAPAPGPVQMPGGPLPGVTPAQAAEALARLRAGDPNSAQGFVEPPPNARRAFFNPNASPSAAPQTEGAASVPSFRRGAVLPVASGGGGRPTDYYERARREAGLSGLDSKYTFAENEARDRERTGFENQANHQMEAADRRADAAEDYRAKLAGQADGEAQFHAEHRAIMDEQVKNLRTAIDDYKAAGAEDPTKQGFLETMGGAVAIALGAFGASLNHGPNYALDIINKKMERQVEQQRIKIDKAKGNIAAQDTLYGSLRQQGLDHDTAAAAEKSSMLDDYKAQVEAMAAKAQSPEIRDRADQAIAAADKEKAVADKTTEQGLRARAFALQKADAQAAAAGAAARAKAEQERRDKDREYGLKVAEFEDRRDERQAGREERRAERDEKGAKEERAHQLETRSQLDVGGEYNTPEQEKAEAAKLASGTRAGDKWQHLPSFVPGVETAREHANDREAYNRKVLIAVGGAYKLGTSATEPRQHQMLEHLTDPYVIRPEDTEADVARKRAALRDLVKSEAASKGELPPNATDDQREALAKLRAMGMETRK